MGGFKFDENFVTQSRLDQVKNSQGNYIFSTTSNRQKTKRKRDGRGWRKVGSWIGNIFSGGADSINNELSRIQLPTVQTELKSDKSMFYLVALGLGLAYLFFGKKSKII